MPSQISIHALLAESDPPRVIREPTTSRFLSTLSLRRATRHCTTYLNCSRFLSTLSLRRATLEQSSSYSAYLISIHALLAESDTETTHERANSLAFLSTLSLRRATNTPIKAYNIIKISIHALLAESDPRTGLTCGDGQNISIHALLAESDKRRHKNTSFHKLFLSTLSLRRATSTHHRNPSKLAFLSTLSLRRATAL